MNKDTNITSVQDKEFDKNQILQEVQPGAIV